MTLSMGIFTFINAWWITLFFVLPFVGKTPRWKKIFIINSGISLSITLLLCVLIHSEIIPLKHLQ